MDVLEIARKIENPFLSTTQDVPTYEQLISKYPYAQTFPLLLLITLGRNKPIDFESSLSQHSFRISDRAHLYFLINKNQKENQNVSAESSTTTIIPEPEEKAPILEKEEIFQSVESSTIETAIESKEPLSTFEKEPTSQLDDNFELSKNLNDFHFLKVEEMSFDPVTIFATEEKITEKTEEPFLPDLSQEEVAKQDNSYVEQAVSSEDDIAEISANENTTIELESIENQEEPTQVDLHEIIEIEKKEHKGADSSENDKRTASSFDLVHEPETTRNEFEEIEIVPSSFELESKTVSFDFLEKETKKADQEITSHAISEGYHTLLEEEEPKKVDTKEQEVGEISDRKSFNDWLKTSALTHSDEYLVKQRRADEIVEKFIQNDPKIARISKTEIPEKKAAEFFKVSKIAKDSLSEKWMPVSTTLAEIYEAQGNFIKAIESYEQLILLNPEKKSFFANQIKKLQKKIKN